MKSLPTRSFLLIHVSALVYPNRQPTELSIGFQFGSLWDGAMFMPAQAMYWTMNRSFELGTCNSENERLGIVSEGYGLATTIPA
ncbi:hypothetical protein E4T56_gene6748 [Termitomyces sp. T112]|nr:hypothetical protein E4T56_gene6748 [Termitomyces sp. T112]